jgi:trk system potassium uptake protein TrkA
VYIIIVGLGGIGQNIATIAVAEKHNVVAIDMNAAKCKDIALMCDLVTINGDATSPAVLEEAGISEADALVTTTGSDAVNLIVTMQARKKGVKNIRTIVNVQEHLELFKQEGITVHKNPNAIVAEDIYNAMLRPNISDFVTLGGGKAEILEILIHDKTRANGKAIKDVGLPANVSIIAIERGNEVIVPDSDTVLQAGDSVFVFVRKNLIDRIFDLFSTGDLVK